MYTSISLVKESQANWNEDNNYTSPTNYTSNSVFARPGENEENTIPEIGTDNNMLSV